MSDGITVAVTEHAVERFRQRVGARRGGPDVPPRVARRVTDVLKPDDAALVDPGRRWRERRDRG